ncbi:MAG TPA: CCA tRNA nucleotidyltransferase [Methanocorpusculum sp.]|nr:CCA tRNA nucleotidyltransferase [Methanocorpusculum sp.]
MRNEYEKVVLERILPTEDERSNTNRMGQKLVDAVMEIAGIPAMMIGSVARGTWVRGDKDIDIFMRFPPETTREELQEKGLAIGYAVVEKFGGTAEEMYAEHPYLNAVIEGYDVDLVPCYNVASTAEMKCSVDRTPFHTQYLIEKIVPLREDVLLFKQFCKGGGIYGSDHMTGGFSGYLCELLILNYGGFTEFMEAATKYRYGEVVDIEHYYPDAKTARKHFTAPMIVIDPTDRNRNVAASLTPTQFSEFIELARDYCEKPSASYFQPDAPAFISKNEFAQQILLRRTSLFALRFKTPALVADTVVPQLRKTVETVRSMLTTEEFQVHRAEVAMGPEHCLIFLELFVAELPNIMIRTGPPVWSHENADRFVEKYFPIREFAGPWIEEDRYYTEVPRKYVTAKSLLEDSSKIFSGALGKHVRISMGEGYEVLSGDEIWSEEFSDFLSAYFSRSSHAVRKLRQL